MIKGIITTDSTEIQTTIRDYYKQLYAHKRVNMEEMNKFLDTCTHPRLNQEEVETLNRSVTRSEVKAAINSLSIKKKVQVQMGSQPNSTRCTKRSGTIHSETILNNTKRGNPPNSFYETNIILIAKPSRN